MQMRKKLAFVMAFSMIFTALPTNTIASLAEETVSIEDSAAQSFDIEDNNSADEAFVQYLDIEDSAEDEILGLNIDTEEVSLQNQSPETSSSQEQSGEFSIDAVTSLDDSADSTVMQDDISDSEDNAITVQEYWYEKYFAATDSVVLEVQAQCSTGNLSYEWQQFDSVSLTYQKITGNSTAENARLELGTLEEGSYQFSCRLSDDTANSEKYVFFDVYVGEYISVERLSQKTFSIKPGEEVILDLQASSNLPDDTLTYNWSFESYSGTTQALTDKHTDSVTVTPSQSGTYSCKITSTKGKKLSETIGFYVSVDSGLRVDEDLVVVNGEIGSEVSLSVSAVSDLSKTLTYEWYHQEKSGSSYVLTKIDGETQNACKRTVAAKVIDYYLCRISDGCNQVECSFYVIPSKKLQILTSDAERKISVQAGDSAVLKIEADTAARYGSVQYLWNLVPYGQENVSGDTLTIENVTENKIYTCIVSDLCHTEMVEFYISVNKDAFAETALNFETAAEIQAGQSTDAVIAFLNSSMYFKFVPKHSGYYDLSLDSSEKQRYIYVYDADQNFLYGSTTMKLSCWLDSENTYYIQTGYYPAAQTIGTYPLILTYTGECSWDEGTITKEPTCTEEGILVRTCSICQATKEETIPAADHSPSEWKIEREATCAERGIQYRECVSCHERMETAEIPVTNEHSYEKSYTMTKAPTVLTEGWEVRKCMICHAEEGRSIAKLAGTIKLTSKKVYLQVKKSADLSTLVTGLSAGDSIKSWQSDKKSVAEVDKKGNVVGKKAGTAKITVTLASKKSASITVVVQKKAVRAEKISISSDKLTLAIGKSTTLKPVITPFTASEQVVYKSLNKKIATVNSKGKVTAKAAGKATILITAGKQSVKVTVTVPKPALKAIKNIPKSKTLKKGQSLTLHPKKSPSGAAAKFTYSSSNRTVATVSSSGKIKAKKKGTAVITVRSGTVTASCKIKVK